MPFQKNFPALGTTKRLRVPKKVTPHFESILEHLDHQVQQLGQDYIEAFFAQWQQAMRELEFSSASASRTIPEDLDQEALKKHFVEHYISQSNAQSNMNIACQNRTFSPEYIEFYCDTIRKSFEELQRQSQTSSLGAWKIIEKKLIKKRVDLDHIDIFHEICYGFFEQGQREFQSNANTNTSQCTLADYLCEIKWLIDFEPLLKLRDLIAQT